MRTASCVINLHVAYFEGDRIVNSDEPAVECIEIQLIMKLNAIQVCLQTACRAVASLDVDGITASMTLRKSNTRVELVLRSVSVGDLNPDTIYNKVKFVFFSNEGPSIFS